jgi:hypothetical protein
MPKHVRTTITVPPDLKARMDAVDETVNWSAIACQAFEQKLADLIRQKGPTDMNEVIERLRASKQKFESEQFTQGHEAGQEWAKDAAEAEELIQLGKLRDRCGWRDWDGFFATGDRDAYGASERFVFAIWPERDGERAAATDFWEQLGVEDVPSDEFVRGFAEGALSVWDQVKDQL